MSFTFSFLSLLVFLTHLRTCLKLGYKFTGLVILHLFWQVLCANSRRMISSNYQYNTNKGKLNGASLRTVTVKIYIVLSSPTPTANTFVNYLRLNDNVKISQVQSALNGNGATKKMKAFMIPRKRPFLFHCLERNYCLCTKWLVLWQC